MSSPRASTEHAKPSPRAYVHIYLKPKCLCPAMPSPRAYTMIPMKAGLPVQCQAYHGVLFKEDCMIYHASDCFLHFCSLQGFCSFVGLGSLLLLCCKVDKLSFQSLGFTSFSTCTIGCIQHPLGKLPCQPCSFGSN